MAQLFTIDSSYNKLQIPKDLVLVLSDEENTYTKN